MKLLNQTTICLDSMATYTRHSQDSNLFVGDNGAIFKISTGTMFYGKKKFKKGYTSIRSNGKGTHAHVLVAETYLAHTKTKTRKYVNHKNGDKSDDRVDNLEYVSPSENILHSFESLGRTTKASCLSHMAKLTPDQVAEVKTSSLSGASLARKFCVHRQTVYDIRNGRTHV